MILDEPKDFISLQIEIKAKKGKNKLSNNNLIYTKFIESSKDNTSTRQAHNSMNTF